MATPRLTADQKDNLLVLCQAIPDTEAGKKALMAAIQTIPLYEDEPNLEASRAERVPDQHEPALPQHEPALGKRPKWQHLLVDRARNLTETARDVDKARNWYEQTRREHQHADRKYIKARERYEQALTALTGQGHALVPSVPSSPNAEATQ